MTLTYQFNQEDPVTANVRELHVLFDDNILQLVVDGQQLVNIWKELGQVNFPNQGLTLIIADVQNP